MIQSEIYNEVFDLIYKQFTIIANQMQFSKKLYIYKERTFSLLNTINNDGVYLVVHFNNGTIMLGGTILDITIEVLSEDKSFDNAYNLLLQYAKNYNYVIPTSENGAFIQQVYTTPSISQNFADVNGGFRALMSINSTIVYGENISGITSIEVDGGPIIYTSAKCGLGMSPNSANVGNNNSRTTTKNKFGSFTLVFNMVAQDNDFTDDIDSIMLGVESINKVFTFKITKNDVDFYKNLVVNNIDYQQEQGGIPTYTISFTE